jgi:glycopeptide antibiotics resistance protein
VKRTSLILTTGLIVLVVFPWGDFQGHTHWQKVGWIPFVSPPVRLFDIIANALLFMPFGAALMVNSGRRGRKALAVATLAGTALSFSGEAAQLYSHARFPSATDLVCNTFGAFLGASLVRQNNPRS